MRGIAERINERAAVKARELEHRAEMNAQIAAINEQKIRKQHAGRVAIKQAGLNPFKRMKAYATHDKWPQFAAGSVVAGVATWGLIGILQGGLPTGFDRSTGSVEGGLGKDFDGSELPDVPNVDVDFNEDGITLDLSRDEKIGSWVLVRAKCLDGQPGNDDLVKSIIIGNAQAHPETGLSLTAELLPSSELIETIDCDLRG